MAFDARYRHTYSMYEGAGLISYIPFEIQSHCPGIHPERCLPVVRPVVSRRDWL